MAITKYIGPTSCPLILKLLVHYSHAGTKNFSKHLHEWQKHLNLTSRDGHLPSQSFSQRSLHPDSIWKMLGNNFLNLSLSLAVLPSDRTGCFSHFLGDKMVLSIQLSCIPSVFSDRSNRRRESDVFFQGITDSFQSHIYAELKNFEGVLVKCIHLGIYLCQNIISSRSCYMRVWATESALSHRNLTDPWLPCNCQSISIV